MAKIENGKEKRGPIFYFLISDFARRASAAAWRWLREVSDDDAYERYLTRAGKARVTPSPARGGIEGSACSASVLSPREFYLFRLEHKYSRPTRCC